eukprot:c29594_g1_i1 orf=1-213(-)
MKVLKGFFKKKARPEGSMVEGWLVHESLCYTIEYLSIIDLMAPRIWTNEDNEKIFGEVLEGKGKLQKLRYD